MERYYIDRDVLRSIRFDTNPNQISHKAKLKQSMDLSERLQSYERIILVEAMKNCRTTREMAAFLNISQPSVIRKLNKADLKMTKTSPS